MELLLGEGLVELNQSEVGFHYAWAEQVPIELQREALLDALPEGLLLMAVLSPARPAAPRPKFLRRMFQKKMGCFLRRRRKGKKIFRL
ncbi:unnamed protein product [Symbiodinium microadriaticum]|nr:unnamed protein product [Symbiodinium microadriaticum]CAE7890141.1 unnamed protein product [Symbiodinium sp. KB8]